MTIPAKAALLALGLLLTVPLHAETPAIPQTIIVTAHAEVNRIPGGADLIDSKQFADTVAVSLRDALAFSPGVYTQPRFGQEVRISIRGSGVSRGFHMRGLLLLQDGVPINLADNNGDFQEYDPQVFEQIAVYRGGNALRFGGSALGGAINAITPTGRTAPGLELRLDGGSFNTIRGKAAAGFATERGDAYLALTGDRSEGDRDHADRHAVRFNGNVGLRLTERIETRFYASLNHINQRLPGALTRNEALTTPRLSEFYNILTDQQRDIDSLRLQNRTTVDLRAGTLELGAFYNAKQLFHPIYQVIDQKSDDRGILAHLDLAGELAGIPIEATLGTDARFGTVQARQYLNIGGHRGAQTADARQKARTIDSYGEVRIKPVARVMLIAGGVYVSGNRQVDNHFNPSASGDVTYHRFAPKLGMLWQPQAEVQVYANYSRSIELPGFIELTQSQLLPGFIDLVPQRAWTAEIGTRGRIGIARWDVSLYRADLNGEMLQYNLGPDIPASTFNAGRTRHQGIEAALDLALTPWALLRQSYTYSDFRFRNDIQFADNRLPVVPKHVYRASLRLGTERLSVTPTTEWVPQGAFADYTNSARVPGYALFGLGAAAELKPGVSVFVDARNLTNKKAIGDISAVTIATPASAIYYPVERRAIYAGIRAQLGGKH